MDDFRNMELRLLEKNEQLQEENTLLRAQLQAQTERSDFVEECVAEMATIIYV